MNSIISVFYKNFLFLFLFIKVLRTKFIILNDFQIVITFFEKSIDRTLFFITSQLLTKTTNSMIIAANKVTNRKEKLPLQSILKLSQAIFKN